VLHNILKYVTVACFLNISGKLYIWIKSSLTEPFGYGCTGHINTAYQNLHSPAVTAWQGVLLFLALDSNDDTVTQYHSTGSHIYPRQWDSPYHLCCFTCLLKCLLRASSNSNTLLELGIQYWKKPDKNPYFLCAYIVLVETNNKQFQNHCYGGIPRRKRDGGVWKLQL
jgi:hypothetical protein